MTAKAKPAAILATSNTVDLFPDNLTARIVKYAAVTDALNRRV